MAWLFLPGDIDAVEHHRAGARRHHAHQALQRRALAGAVAAEQRHHLVALDAQRRRRTGCGNRRSRCSVPRPRAGSCVMLRARRRDRLPAPAALPLISSGVPSTSTRPSCSTVMRSASSNSASMSWSMTIMVRPWLIDFSSLHRLDPLARAHAGQRLVEQQQAGRRARAQGRSPAGASRRRPAADTGVSARARQVDQRQRVLDLLVEARNAVEAAQQVEPELAAQLGQRGDRQVLAHRQASEELVDLVALGQAELADVGDVHAGDVAALEHDRAGGRRHLAGQHLEEGASCRRRSGR